MLQISLANWLKKYLSLQRYSFTFKTVAHCHASHVPVIKVRTQAQNLHNLIEESWKSGTELIELVLA